MSEQHHCLQSEILDLMPERVVRFRVDDHSIVYCNPAWAQGHQATVEALLGRRLDDLLTPREMEALHAQLARLALTGSVDADPEPVPAPEGSDRWLAWRDQPVDDGREVLAVGREITERRRAERALAASEERFRDLADRANDVVFHVALRPRPRFTYLSPAVESLLGVTAAELETDPNRFVEMLDEDGRALVLVALEGGELPERLDLRFKRRDGTVVVEIQITPLPDGLQGIGRDVTEVRALQAELTAMSMRDPLTGLVNRRLLDELLSAAVRAAERNKRPVTVAFLDLDAFKVVNDVHGHAAGDQVLCVVAERLLQAVRASDVVARLGGDEFVLLLEGDRAATDEVIHRVQATLARPIDLRDGSVVRARSSIGRACTTEVGWNPERLLASADAEMYETKRARAVHT